VSVQEILRHNLNPAMVYVYDPDDDHKRVEQAGVECGITSHTSVWVHGLWPRLLSAFIGRVVDLDARAIASHRISLRSRPLAYSLILFLQPGVCLAHCLIPSSRRREYASPLFYVACPYHGSNKMAQTSLVIWKTMYWDTSGRGHPFDILDGSAVKEISHRMSSFSRLPQLQLYNPPIRHHHTSARPQRSSSHPSSLSTCIHRGSTDRNAVSHAHRLLLIPCTGTPTQS
jgi:hypothetical protein